MHIQNKLNTIQERKQLLDEPNTTKEQSGSIFDVHSNGVIDEGDFSQNDLLNNDIKNFLNTYINKEWTSQLENKIAGILNTLNKKNFKKKVGKYKITMNNEGITIVQGLKETKIDVTKDSSVTKDYIQKLFDIITSFSGEEIEDFINEINGIDLTDNVNYGGLGFFDCSTDIMQLSTLNGGSGINKNTIIHETGHGVSNLHNAHHSYTQYAYDNEISQRFGNIYGIDILLEKLTKAYGNNPCFSDTDTLFEEYSLYKQGLPTQFNSEDILKKMESSDDKDTKLLIEIIKNPVQQYVEKVLDGATNMDLSDITEKDVLKATANTCFKQKSGIDYLFQKLQEEYGKFGETKDDKHGDLYCLNNVNEFFAEYYLYNKEGSTTHGSEKLFAELEKSENKDIQDFLKIIKSHLEVKNKDKKYRKSEAK